MPPKTTEGVGCDPPLEGNSILMSLLTMCLVAGSCFVFADNMSGRDSVSGSVGHRESGTRSAGEKSSDIGSGVGKWEKGKSVTACFDGDVGIVLWTGVDGE